MGIMIAIVATFAFVMILLFYHPKKQKQMMQKNSAIEIYNDAAFTCNRLSNEYSFALRNKQSEIIIANDVQAGKALRDLADDANEELELMADYITRAYECLNKSDVAGMTYCIEHVNDGISRVKAYMTQITSLVVTDHRRAQKEAEIKIVNQVSYFDGCSTREEIETRYKALAKVFHPDAKAGDEETFKSINEQYKKLTTGGL